MGHLVTMETTNRPLKFWRGTIKATFCRGTITASEASPAENNRDSKSMRPFIRIV